MPLTVEREVDDHAPIVATRLQRIVRQLADIAEHDLDRAPSAVPHELVPYEQLVSRADPDLFEQDLL